MISILPPIFSSLTIWSRRLEENHTWSKASWCAEDYRGFGKDWAMGPRSSKDLGEHRGYGR